MPNGDDAGTALPSRFVDWTPGPDPVRVVAITSPQDYERLIDYYAPGGDGSRPLRRVFEVAADHGVRSIVIEHRYIDVDYRDEHARFYATTFRRYPSVCHRLHFFAESAAPDASNLASLKDAYRGYAVLRPLDRTPVGRTMLAPPPELQGNDATVTTAADTVHLLGEPFAVAAAPFMSQDAQFLRCAHAATWMTLYHAHLLHGMPRRLPGDIHDAATGGVVVSRQLPSGGLSQPQMLNGLHALDLPADCLKLPQSRAASRQADYLSLPATLCRYVNSQTMPIVASRTHAWVIVGYRNVGIGPAHDNIVLYRNDDAAGPYVRVDDPWGESSPAHDPWLVAIPPMPRKVYLPAERAEPIGRRWLLQAARHEAAAAILKADRDGDLTFMAYAIPANEYKRHRLEKGQDPGVATAYRRMHLPRYVWVVEAIDRRLRDAREPCVLGEAVVDSTAHHQSSETDKNGDALLALHVPGRGLFWAPDWDIVWEVAYDASDPYRTGCPIVPHA